VIYRDMKQSSSGHEHLSDQQLVAEINRLAVAERQATVALISALAEFDARRLYLGQGCSSMFTYCTQVLHLAEHAAYNRIEAARAAHRFPTILEWLSDGRVHLSAVRLLSPHLTDANHRGLLAEASHKSKRQIEEIVARLQPRADAPSSVRKVPSLPAPTLTSTSSAARPDPQSSETPVDRIPVCTPTRQKVEPLAPGRYKVQFTVTSETYEKFRRAQSLLRHRVPNGDPAAIFDRALTVLLDALDKQRLAATGHPRAVRPARKLSRHVPATVRREVWARDEGRCKFEGLAGRCRETGFLEIHHVVPYASGGPTTVENLELRCAAHNRYEAAQHFGLFVRERQPNCFASDLGMEL
jgi:hypothetical protein